MRTSHRFGNCNIDVQDYQLQIMAAFPDVAVFPHSKTMNDTTTKSPKTTEQDAPTRSSNLCTTGGHTFETYLQSPGVQPQLLPHLQSGFPQCSNILNSTSSTHTNTEKRKQKKTTQTNQRQWGTLRVANKQTEVENEALQNPKRAIELGSFNRNRETKKTR